MSDWVTISSLATAGGTLVLAVATFSSVKSANRAARVAERSLLVGLRPLLIPSREDDPVDHVRFGDDHRLSVPGHGGVIDVEDGRVYMAIGLRNAGAGMAVIHGWHAQIYDSELRNEPPDADAFRRQQLDIYIPAGGDGYWQGAVRDETDPQNAELTAACKNRERVLIDLMYGDQDGGQRTIARFSLIIAQEEGDGGGARLANVLRYWNLDGQDPRDRDD